MRTESKKICLKKNFSEGKLGNGMKYGIINKQIKGNKVIASFQFQVSNAKDLENKKEIGDLGCQPN